MDLRELKIFEGQYKERHPWELARIEVVCKLIDQSFPQLLSTQANVLDVGCGDIFLIEQLSKRYPLWKFYAADTAFTDDQLDYFNAHAPASIKVFKEVSHAFKSLDNQKVDIVLLLDVIEHIEKEIDFLSYLTQFHPVTSSTAFLITVPAFQSLFCSHDVFLGHYRRYSNESLQKAIHNAGLIDFKVGYFFSSLLPFRGLASLKEKWFPVKHNTAKGIGAWKGGKVTGKVMKSVLVADFYIANSLQKLGIKIPGLSNYIVCRKFA